MWTVHIKDYLMSWKPTLIRYTIDVNLCSCVMILTMCDKKGSVFISIYFNHSLNSVCFHYINNDWLILFGQ